MVKKLIVVAAYNSNGGFIETYIRALVVSSGVNAGISYAEGTGYFLKQPKGTVERGFDLTNAGEGAIDIDTVAPAKSLSYIRRGAPTTGKDVAPTNDKIMEYYVSTGGKINVAGLQSQTWYAFSEAVVLPVPKANVVGPGPTPSSEKKLTPMKVTKGHRVSFSAKSTSHYAWSPWQYIFVQ